MEFIFQASLNTPLRNKLVKKPPRTITPLLQLDNLIQCWITKDCNSMGHEYYRFLCLFEGDDTRYFTVCDWDNDTPIMSTWTNGQTIYSFVVHNDTRVVELKKH